MAKIPLISLVGRDQSFVDAYNALVAQEHPISIAYQFIKTSERFEEEMDSYRKLYEQKLNECRLTEPDEERTYDEEKLAALSLEMTDFCRTTMIEIPSLSLAELAHAKIKPEDLRVILPLFET